MARYIDADYMKKMVDMYGTNKYGMLDENIRVFIDQMPTADVRENVHGNWVETSEGTMCGNCHKFPYDDSEYHIANWYSDFCPNCGADMRERRTDD